MNVANLLRTAALSQGNEPAICLGASHLVSYASLSTRAARLAGALQTKFALTPGTRIAIVMTNSPEYLEVMFGAWWAGLVVVPINARLHVREVEYILKKSASAVCFTNSDTDGSISSLGATCPDLKAIVSINGREFESCRTAESVDLVHRQSSDPAWLFFTSGTTGRPKAATLTHLNLLVMSLTYLADIQAAVPGHAIFHAAPMSHGTGLLAIPHVAKATANVMLESRSLDHDEIFRLLDSYKNVTMYHTPTMLKRMVNHPGLADCALHNLNTVFYGGSPMYRSDLEFAIDRIGSKLIQMWAQAETPNTGTYLSKAHHLDRSHPRYAERIASAGIARTGLEIRIGDPEGHTLAADELGEVLVRGDVVMAGYWEDPETNLQTLRGGWLHTGDLGSMDVDSFLTIKDRAKDMIISGGFNIYPREIEEILLRHPDVIEASVIGRVHPDYVEEVVACVVKRPDSQLTSKDLDELCLDHIARFKRPRDYVFLSELPKGYYGKVEKRQLRDQLAAARAQAQGNPSPQTESRR
jgi:long-chain acyl-CoA synthetase